MGWKRKVGDRSKFQEKISMQMMLMGCDYKSELAQQLNRRIWKRKNKLSRKKMRKLQYLLCMADTATLLSFTVALGMLIWCDYLKLKRRIFEKKLSEKIKQRSVKKNKRSGKPGKMRRKRRCTIEKKRNGRRRYVLVPKIVTGFQMRPVLGSRSRMVIRRKVTRQHVKVDGGSLMYRLTMAMKYLSLRNAYITSKWEFWAICLIHQVFGFWGSIAFGEDLSDSLISIAKKLEIYVVSSQHMERLESSYGCSSSRRCIARVCKEYAAA